MSETDVLAAVETRLIGPSPRLCVDVCGPEDAPLLLFFHGIGGNRLNWRRQVEAFGAEGWLAVAWDARGYGGSDDYEGPLDFGDFARDAVRVIDHFDRARAHIVGLSMGGRIALDLWRRFPDRVASLTLADTSAGSKETQDPARVEAFLAARRAPLLAGKTPADIAPQVVETLIGPNATSAQRAELTESLASLHAESYLKTLDTVTRFTDFPDPGTIDVPVQVIVGAEDRVAPPHVARAMADAIPGARFDVLEGAGHISNVEAPDAFNAALRAFLAGQRG